MALANQAAGAGAATAPGAESQTSITAIAAGGGPVHIPDAAFLFNATFEHAGSDLKLVGPDGNELLITNYFGAGAPSLLAPNHAMLDGQTVTLLAGPQFPGQYAQAGSAQQAATSVGKVETLQGEVTAQHADGSSQTLKVGDLIFESDVVSTGSGSLIGMKLSDGTLLSLQESSKLAINEFVYQPGGADNSALLNVIHGTFSLLAGQVAPTGDMKIQTPIATMGIRGTSILGVNVDAILGRLSLTQDPDGHVGFIEIFNNLNGNLFTVLRTVFEKISVSENGLLAITPKSPDELSTDQNLTQLLHNFYSQVPEAGETPQHQNGSHQFTQPNIQEINFDNTPPPPDTPELLVPQELLEEFIQSLLQIEDIRDEIVLALQTDPSAGSVELVDQLEGEVADAPTGEGGAPVDTMLPFDFGSSGPGSVGFANLNEKPVLDANGEPVTNGGEPLSYVWDPETNTLTAIAPGGEGEDGVPVFTIVVNPTTGEVTVTITGAVDHFGANGESLSIDIPFTVQAANGASVTGTLTVGIDDDVPMFSNPEGSAPGVSNASVNEDDIAAITGVQPAGTDGVQDPSSSGVLKVDFGADGFGSTAFTGAFDVPNAGGGTLVAGGEGIASGLTSDGSEVLFRLSGDGQVIEGYVAGENGDEVVLQATLNPGDAGYEVELFGNIDHQPGSTGRGAGQSINFTVAASDGDGDSIDVTLSTRILDDAASTSQGSRYVDLQEADIVTGADAAPDTASKSFTIDFGADGYGSSAFTGEMKLDIGPGVEGNISFNVSGGPQTIAEFTSNGRPITFELVDGNTIHGYVASADNGGNGDIQVLELALSDTDTGVTVSLFESIDHIAVADGAPIEQLRVDATVAFSDGDGDTVTSILRANLHDDAPLAAGDSAKVTGQQLSGSNVIVLLDRSNSMNDPSGDGETSRFEVARTAAMALLAAAGINQALVVDFANAVHDSNWGSTEDATAYLNGLHAGGGGTDLDGALTRVYNEYWNADPAAKTYIYAISDGGASTGFFGLGGDHVGIGDEVAWKLFLASAGVDGVFGYSVGGNGGSQLEPVGWNPSDPFNQQDPQTLGDAHQLVGHFYDQTGYVPPTAEGNVLANDHFGADGVDAVSSIVIDGVHYGPDTGSLITLPGGDQQNEGQFDLVAFDGVPPQGSSITIGTDQGGIFTFHFADNEEGGHSAGDWNYIAPTGEHSLPYENIQYTITDGDGDTSTSNLIIAIDPDAIQNVHIGGEGEDTLTSTPDDVDVLVGGLGADTFVLNSHDVTDFIADYDFDGGDVIDLSSLLDGVTAENYDAFVQIDDRGDGAVDALQVNTGSEDQPNFVDVAMLNGDAGVNIIVNDGGPAHQVDNPANVA